MIGVLSKFAAACKVGDGAPPLIPTWYKYLDGETVGDKCTPKLDFTGDLQGSVVGILLGVFDIILFIAGLVAVGFIIFGAFQYMLAQGNPEGSKKARDTILNALIGLAIVLVSSTVVGFLGGNIL